MGARVAHFAVGVGSQRNGRCCGGRITATKQNNILYTPAWKVLELEYLKLELAEYGNLGAWGSWSLEFGSLGNWSLGISGQEILG